MLVSGSVDAIIGTNCWVVAPAAGEECIIVDPGFDVLDQLDAVLAEHRLRPAAVLLTHGHADHVWSVTPVCRGAGVPALVHGDDRYRLRDPLADLPAEFVAMLEQRFGSSARWSEPDDVRPLAHAQHLDLAGLGIDVLHTPGHTEGSAVLVLDGVPDHLGGTEGTGPLLAGATSTVLSGATSTVLSGATSTVLSGDVLFAGSIGRTDLPGGDGAAMRRSLREVVLPMPDDRLVLPGHGGATTIARERRGNPFLRQLS